jgi:hypothetical protein
MLQNFEMKTTRNSVGILKCLNESQPLWGLPYIRASQGKENGYKLRSLGARAGVNVVTVSNSGPYVMCARFIETLRYSGAQHLRTTTERDALHRNIFD